MPLFGAHMSIAGGYYLAAERAAEAGCEVVQLFSKNNSQWRAKEISDEEAQLFRETMERLNLSHPLVHDSYLINLASPDDELWKKSIDAFVAELHRAELLGIPLVVTHPGSYVDSSEKAGLKRIIRALNEVHRQTRSLAAQCLLENTAGQGSALGWKFEHLAAILDGVKAPERLGGVCLDTCHTLAAGYPLADPKQYSATMKSFDKLVGIKRIRAVHLNDSKKGLGSRVDRHEHIGRGQVGLAAFRNLLNDARLRKVPMYLETPKGKEKGEDLDVINLRTLRSLMN